MVDSGTLLHVCISSKKGIAKHEIPSAKLLLDYGMEADAHAGQWHRQVSLLAHTDIEFMRAKGLTLKTGAFGENLVIDGVNTDELGVGSQLRVGPVLLELTQVGKVCHTRCAIYYTTGDCIMPRTGLFARVVEAGEVTAGMPVEIVHRVDRSTLQAAVITVSDRCSAGQTVDTAGPAVAALLSGELGARIAWTKLVPDEVSEIAEAIKDFSERRVDIILTAGGTGPDVRDVTPEATRKVLDRELPGLAEAMRAASSAKTPNAWLSRAVAGIRRKTLIVNLPGSKKAAVENLEAILPVIPHAVKILRHETAHPETDAGRIVTIQKAGAPTLVVSGEGS
jgi:molybdenum cofactor synthesis domain-containing protein